MMNSKSAHVRQRSFWVYCSLVLGGEPRENSEVNLRSKLYSKPTSLHHLAAMDGPDLKKQQQKKPFVLRKKGDVMLSK